MQDWLWEAESAPLLAWGSSKWYFSLPSVWIRFTFWLLFFCCDFFVFMGLTPCDDDDAFLAALILFEEQWRLFWTIVFKFEQLALIRSFDWLLWGCSWKLRRCVAPPIDFFLVLLLSFLKVDWQYPLSANEPSVFSFLFWSAVNRSGERISLFLNYLLLYAKGL